MKREGERKKLPVPNYLRRWINLKKAFPKHLIDKKAEKSDWRNVDTIKKCKPAVSGMPEMLSLLDLEMEGQHHSGIDDARNLARCVIETLKKGHKYTQGMVH